MRAVFDAMLLSRYYPGCGEGHECMLYYVHILQMLCHDMA